MASRTPDEIRASLQQQRDELAASIQQLRDDAAEVSDWRRVVSRNQAPATAAAAFAGFLLAGGFGAFTGLLRR